MSKGCSPNVVTLNILIDECCKAKRVDDVIKLLHEISTKGFVPEAITYSTLIHGLYQVGFLNAAPKLLQEMISECTVDEHGASTKNNDDWSFYVMQSKSI
ncbi:hypothetical protein HID58_032902 [Brassica napus]|uniref:Pentatricopeptide repeat-containing protein n=1 Tax=Brassica napus TaxID=3708 RepID=A0ABQ8BXP5_BRANA|nr:hypothetical protein HID58_032902 [Brassica napus]